jgi:hypothetical protein
MKDPVGIQEEDDSAEEQFVRLSLNGNNSDTLHEEAEGDTSESEEEGEHIEDDDTPFLPEFRLVKRDDPEAYAFSTPQFSAHKMPKEVVDASISGPGGMSEFLGQWQDIIARQAQESDTESDH